MIKKQVIYVRNRKLALNHELVLKTFRESLNFALIGPQSLERKTKSDFKKYFSS